MTKMKIPVKYPEAYGDKEIGEVTEWHQDCGQAIVKITDNHAKKLIEAMIMQDVPISMDCKQKGKN